MNIHDNNTASGIVRRPFDLESEGFDIGVAPVDTILTNNGTYAETIDDAVYTATETDSVRREFTAQVITGLRCPATPTLTSSDPAVATVSAGGSVTRVADGHVSLVADNGLLRVRRDIHVYETAAVLTRVFNGHASGSLGAHCEQQVTSRLAGKDPQTDMRLFSTLDHVTGTYVWNAGRWCANVDLTCLSVYVPSATAISPLHVAYAEHYRPSAVRFVLADGTPVSRTIVAEEVVYRVDAVNGNQVATDLVIGKLNAALPAGIKPARFFPTDYLKYFPTMTQWDNWSGASDDTYWGPVGIRLNQHKEASVGERVVNVRWGINHGTTAATRQAFYRDIVGGDSGSPAGHLVNGQFVVTNTWQKGGPGGGPDLCQLRDAIDAAMSSLGGGYATIEVDLSSGFNIY